MAAKKCDECGTRRRASRAESGMSDNTMCLPCLDYALEENRHSDDGHESTPADDCPVCVPELDPRTPAKPGHSKGVAKTRTSHATCDHEKTKAARAKCRKLRATAGA